MTGCYDQHFSDLIALVEKSRDFLFNSQSESDKAFGHLLYLGDENYRAYNQMVRTNEFRAIGFIEKIAVSLLAEKKTIGYHLYPIDKKYAKLPIKESSKSRPFQIIIEESKK